jgi:hypothetical protein
LTAQYRFNELTDGKGPQKCIDAFNQAFFCEIYRDRSARFRQRETLRNSLYGDDLFGAQQDAKDLVFRTLLKRRPGGTISIPGVYSGFADKIPLGHLCPHPLRPHGLAARTVRHAGEAMVPLSAQPQKIEQLASA